MGQAVTRAAMDATKPRHWPGAGRFAGSALQYFCCNAQRL